MPPKKLCFAILRHYRNDRFISGQPDLLRWNLHDKKTYRKAQKTKIPGCRIISCERTEKSAPTPDPSAPMIVFSHPSLLLSWRPYSSVSRPLDGGRERERDGRGVKSPFPSLVRGNCSPTHSLFTSRTMEKGTRRPQRPKMQLWMRKKGS